MRPPRRIGDREDIVTYSSSQVAGGEVRRRILELAAGEVRRKVLGLGFWVQSFRCFPWAGVNFYLKDELKVAPSTLQMIHSSANVPMIAKALYGFLSDNVNLCGQHRLPYIAIGALLQALSWFTIAMLPGSFISIPILTFFLFISNLGASIAEVANDAIVAETGMQSFVWMLSSSAGALGNLLGGIAVDQLSPRVMFFIFGVIVAVQFSAIINIPESSLNLQKKRRKAPSSKPPTIGGRAEELLVVLSNPEILYSISWFASSYALVPILMGTLFYYHTQQLGLSPSILGLTKVFSHVALLALSMVYNKWLKQVPTRKLLSVLQITITLLMLSDVLFVKGFYRGMGLPDGVYVVFFSGLQEALCQFKVLPFSIMVAKLCPPGCEGSVMAFLMSATALAGIISGCLGVTLAGVCGVAAGDFSGLPKAIVVEATCCLLPLFWSSWIPGDQRRNIKRE